MLAVTMLPTTVSGFALTRIGWSGALGWSYQKQFLEEDESGTLEDLKLGIGVDGYLYQPWIARFGSNIQWITQSRDFEDDDRVDVETTGQVSVEAFPVSRFPFRMYWEREVEEIERNSSQISKQKQESTEFGMSQMYRSLDGLFDASGDYTRREFGVVGGNTAMQMDGQINSRWRDTVSATVGFANSESGAGGVETDSLFALVSSRLYSDAQTHLTGSVRWDEVTITEPAVTEVSTNLLDANLEWNGDYLERKLRMSGEAHYQEQTIDTSSGPSRVRSSSLSQSAAYDLGREWQGFASASLTESQSNGTSSTRDQESVGINYTPTQLTSEKISYNWQAQLVAERSNENEAINYGLRESFQHGLVRRDGEASQGGISIWSADQQLRSDQATDEEPSFGVGHSVSWSSSQNSDRIVHSMNVSASDNRSYEENSTTTSDQVNASFTRAVTGSALSKYQISIFSTYSTTESNFEGNTTQEDNTTDVWTVGFSGERLDSLAQFQDWSNSFYYVTTNTTYNGDASKDTTLTARSEYTHSRLFNIRNLTFSSSLELEEAIDVGDQPTGNGDTFDWENNIKYSIGRLHVSSGLQFFGQRSDGDVQGQFFFTIRRVLGNL